MLTFNNFLQKGRLLCTCRNNNYYECMNVTVCMFSYSQFITDKFLYDQSVAMESLLKCGLKEQLFELAKVVYTYTH